MSSEEHVDLNEGLQAAIIEVLHQRGQSSDSAYTRLRAEIEQRRMPCPPAAWLQAASDEINHGHLYVVSKKTMPESS